MSNCSTGDSCSTSQELLPGAHRRALLGLFSFLLAVYLLTAGGHFYNRDEVGLYFMTASLLERGDFAVPPPSPGNVNTQGGARALDGSYQMPFGIGQPLAAAPLLGLVRLLLPVGSAPYLEVMLFSVFNQFLGALSALLLALLCLELGAGLKHSLFIALAYGLGTLNWVYSQTFFTEPLTTVLGLGCLLALLQSEREIRGRLMVAAIFAGFSVWVRFFTVLVLPVYTVAVLVARTRRSPQTAKVSSGSSSSAVEDECSVAAGLKPAGRVTDSTWPGSRLAWRSAAWFAGVSGLFVMAVLWRNHSLFGGFLETGYRFLPDGRVRGFTHPFLGGLAILLFSPGKSLFLYAPPVVGGLWALFRWERARKLAVIVIVGTLLVYLGGYAKWCRPEGGFTWGPRFLLPVVPLLLVSLVGVQGSPGRRRFLFFLVLLGIGVNSLALTVDFAQRIRVRYQEYYRSDGRYEFWFSPLGDHLSEMVRTAGKVLPSQEREGRNRHFLVPDWGDEPDLWFVHLIREGLPPSIVGGILVVFLLLGGAGLAAMRSRLIRRRE